MVEPDDPILVEVAYALPDRQLIVCLEVPAGTRIGEAIRRSEICDQFPGLRVQDDMVGVFGKRRPLDYQLRPGDRVEIYRPLIADPKEVRRERARKKDDKA